MTSGCCPMGSAQKDEHWLSLSVLESAIGGVGIIGVELLPAAFLLIGYIQENGADYAEICDFSIVQFHSCALRF
jgi:hypothetical protein